jgi:hypothetical protein
MLYRLELAGSMLASKEAGYSINWLRLLVIVARKEEKLIASMVNSTMHSGEMSLSQSLL